MSSTPAFATTPRHGIAAIATANTNRDGTGTMGTVLTAGSGGSVIERIVVIATGTVTAGVVRLFIHDGSNARLWKEVMIPATTPSATVETHRESIVLTGAGVDAEPPLHLPSGYSLRASTHNAENFNVHAEGGDL